MNTDTVKGFRDIEGDEALKREKVRQIVVENFKLFGFEPAETPVIEYEEFVKGENPDDEAVSEVFKLQDRGKRKLALRYEFTFQLKRLAKNKKLPYKRYQIGMVFRDEPIKAGRFRQFTQCDVDIIGSSEIVADAEVLALANSIFTEIKIPFEIQVNNRQLLNAIIESVGIRDKKTELSIIREVDKLEKDRDSAYRNLVKLITKNKTEQLLDYFNKDLKFFLSEGFSGAEDIKELDKLCKSYGVKVSFTPSLARGLSYYTGNVFEIISPKYNLAISGGGRYKTQGLDSVGISFGLDRLSELAKVEVGDTSALIISIGQDEKAIKLAAELRAKNRACSIMFGKVGKAFEYANSYKIPYVILIGDEEVKKGKVKLKDMKTGKEKLVSGKSLIASLV